MLKKGCLLFLIKKNMGFIVSTCNCLSLGLKLKKKACAKMQSITVVKTSCRINTQQIIKAEKSGAKAGKVMY